MEGRLSSEYFARFICAHNSELIIIIESKAVFEASKTVVLCMFVYVVAVADYKL